MTKPERKNKSSREYETNHPKYYQKTEKFRICTCKGLVYDERAVSTDTDGKSYITKYAGPGRKNSGKQPKDKRIFINKKSAKVCGHEWASKLLVPKCSKCGNRDQKTIQVKSIK